MPLCRALNVLYVEDHHAIRDNYARLFKELFSSLESAKDGQEGLTKYQSSKFDLAITDINMPRMDGIEMI